MTTEAPCLPEQHSFDRSRDTNEPVGRCFDCGMTITQVEAQAEEAVEVAFADVPPQDREAYLAALDAESVKENR